jgi:hypothetical protein
MDIHARSGRPCLVQDRHQPSQWHRGQIVRELNDGAVIEVSLDGRGIFPLDSCRVSPHEVRELPSSERLFPEGPPAASRPSGLALGQLEGASPMHYLPQR